MATLNEKDKARFNQMERRNLQILNLFRLFVAFFFFVLAHNNSFSSFYDTQLFHSRVPLVVAFYIVCALMVAVISYVSSQVDVTRISKFTLFIDLFVMIYIA